jgi:hypothetical protein
MSEIRKGHPVKKSVILRPLVPGNIELETEKNKLQDALNFFSCFVTITISQIFKWHTYTPTTKRVLS